MNQILWLPEGTSLMNEKPKIFCLIKDISVAWQIIADNLQPDRSITDMICSRHGQKKSNQQCMSDVLVWWLENADELPNAHIFEFTWKGLYKLLCHSNLGVVAETLKRVLSSPVNSVRGNLPVSPAHKTPIKR